MDCREFEDTIPLYILNDPWVSPSAREEIESHMAICGACRDHYEETKWVLQVLRENKDVIYDVIRRTEQDEALAAIERMTDEEIAEEMANSKPIYTPEEEAQLAALRAKNDKTAQEEEHRAVRARRVHLARWSAAIAASLLVVCGLGFLAFRTFSSLGPVTLASDTGAQNIPFGQEIRTGFLEHKTLHLGGKHTVVVNSGTAFTVTPLHAWLKTGYLVTLKTGELYAEVTHDGNPFTVRTSDADAVITGTKFDIRALPSQTDLTLVEGSVRFTSDGKTVIVRSGQTSSVVAGLPPSVPQPVDALAAIAWVREKAAGTSLAERGISVEDSLTREFLDHWKYPDPPDPATFDYAKWRDEHQPWFEGQFPWIFTAQASLKSNGIDADYLDLLMLSGDIWQFYYPRPFTQPIPAFNPGAIELLAKTYGVVPDNLMLAAETAGWTHRELSEMERNLQGHPAQQYRAALKQWQSDIANAEEQVNGALSGDLLYFSDGACKYLANTRTAAYLWVREHPEQAERMLPAITAMFPAGEARDIRALLAILGKQSVSAGKAANLAMEQPMNAPDRVNDRCRSCCREPDANELISKMLAPLVE